MRYSPLQRSAEWPRAKSKCLQRTTRPNKEADEVFSQSKRPERDRYLLQVDRQTKNSYTTSEAAQSAALAIKTGYPIVRVSVYDSVEHTHNHSGTGSVFLTNLVCLPHCAMSASTPKYQKRTCRPSYGRRQSGAVSVKSRQEFRLLFPGSTATDRLLTAALRLAK
jgi:hypothetical protein